MQERQMCVSYGYCTFIHFDFYAILQKDYTSGQLPELIDVIIKNKAALFVCAVGVPPKWVVDKLHAAGIPIMKYVS